MTPSVALIGTLDTKGAEYAFLRAQLERHGVATLVVDAGIAGDPGFPPDVSARDVAAAAGADLDELRAAHDRGRSVAVMARGAAAVVSRLHGIGEISGVIALGGGGGTTIGTAAMRALPLGVPKVMVSTLAAGDVAAYVGASDIAMLNPVVDIAGLNRVLRPVLANAAAAIAGMAGRPALAGQADRPVVAATMFGVTTPCVGAARELIESAGYEVLVFHATGHGGRAMEDAIARGAVDGVLDVTTTELADELVGGVQSAGPHRLEAAGAHGIPQVVAPGALDMVNFRERDAVPERFRSRRLYEHNPHATLMRTTAHESAQLGTMVADKLNAATGPTVFVWPRHGVSAIDALGEPFHDPAADRALLDALAARLKDTVELVEVDAHINDPAFATEVARRLIQAMEGSGRAVSGQALRRAG